MVVVVIMMVMMMMIIIVVIPSRVTNLLNVLAQQP